MQRHLESAIFDGAEGGESWVKVFLLYISGTKI
jgi:hypothetical protein